MRASQIHASINRYSRKPKDSVMEAAREERWRWRDRDSDSSGSVATVESVEYRNARYPEYPNHPTTREATGEVQGSKDSWDPKKVCYQRTTVMRVYKETIASKGKYSEATKRLASG